MNPIQCDDPECVLELECDLCPTGFHMLHIKQREPTLDFYAPHRSRTGDGEGGG